MRLRMCLFVCFYVNFIVSRDASKLCTLHVNRRYICSAQEQVVSYLSSLQFCKWLKKLIGTHNEQNETGIAILITCVDYIVAV